ncbi:MAG TPA: MarR family winged helix-turn-helix transcriptional regulator [Patescibacteria group bacterium]|nr:MarR family winged helix-turn-helix transcriptional regulator [Patescibacteria group bacterium]
MKTPQISLSSEDAMVLQLISESGEEDIISLERSLGMNRGRVMASLESLRRKGLISIQRISGDWWVHISAKGKQLTHHVWPELTMSPSPSF